MSVRKALPPVPHQRHQVQEEAVPTTAAVPTAVIRQAEATIEAVLHPRAAVHQVEATTVVAQAADAVQEAAIVAVDAVQAPVQAAVVALAEAVDAAQEVEEDNSTSNSTRKRNKDYLCSHLVR